jgi:2-C-methyl-D-erythritol 4-phosphate cytidylyltransferase
VEVGGRPLLEWAVEAFRAAASVERIVVATPPGEDARAAELGVEGVSGGEHRSQSVLAGLELVDGELVVVHDAARPLVTPELIDQVVDRLATDESLAGAIAAAPVTDTVKRAGADRLVTETLDRSELWAVQTPQAFRVDALREALEAGDLERATDDAMLVEERGGTVAIVPSSPRNLKVTTPLDLELAGRLLGER